MISTFPTHLDVEESTADLGDVTTRPATSADEGDLQRLASLEGRDEGAAPHLVAEQDGDVIASLSLADGTARSDPFRLTAEVVELVRAHAERRGAAAPVRRGLRPRILTAFVGTATALVLATGALAANATVTIAGKPVRIVPSTKMFAIVVTCSATDEPCEGVLDVRTSGRIKPYASQPAAVAKVGTFPFSIPAGASLPVKGRVYGPALAQAMLRGRVALTLTPRAIGGALGAPRTVVFTFGRTT